MVPTATVPPERNVCPVASQFPLTMKFPGLTLESLQLEKFLVLTGP